MPLDITDGEKISREGMAIFSGTPPSEEGTTTAETDLRKIAEQHWQTNQIQHFLLHRSLPVDIRHNSKIFREQLREWAAKIIKIENQT